jgi:hypothetical protein
VNAWRYSLLAAQLNELFSIAHAADLPRFSLFDPRSPSALDALGTDPFASAVWAMDQAERFDLPGALDDAEYYCVMAEREVIAHRAKMQRRQTLRYKLLHDRMRWRVALRRF